MRSGQMVACGLLLVACGARSTLPTPQEDSSTQTGAGASGAGGSDASASGAGGAGAGGTGASGGAGGFGGEGGSGAGGSSVGGVEQMVLGAGHSCLRTFDGEVYCWGRNGNGQLGDGTFDNARAPVRTALDAPASFLATGKDHACAILVDGRVACWGRNDFGQLGNGFIDDTGPKGRAVPEIVPLLDDASGPARALALGDRHTCVLLGDQVACWGSGALGAIGTFDDPVPSPFAPPLGSVAELTAGGTFTCVLPPSDPADPFVATIGCMGNNSSGQCGVDAMGSFDAPVPIDASLTPQERPTAGPGSHACATIAGELWCWGANGDGQLGRGDTTQRELPGPALFEGQAALVDAVAPGFAHTCALRAGRVWCWGDNGSGQLGSNTSTPDRPSLVPELEGVLAIGSGTVHSCAYLGPQEVYCWGGNDFGQLGTGDTMASGQPVRVALP